MGAPLDSYQPVTSESSVALIDASAIIFRSYYGNSSHLQRPTDGKAIGAVSNAVQTIFRLLTHYSATGGPYTHMAAIFDSPLPNHRHEIDPHYKAHREAPPSMLNEQRPLIREAFSSFGLACIGADGWEADDLIATYARRAEDHGAKITIFSPDKDLMQLVGPSIRTWDRGNFNYSQDVRAHFGVEPDQLLDYLSLVGDVSDGIAGVYGIGPKKAAKILNTHGSVSKTTYADDTLHARRLIRLVENAPMPLPLELTAYTPGFANAYDFCMRMEFEGLAKKIRDWI